MEDKNKWNNQYISKHFKNQKNLSHWRHNKYRQRQKTFIRRQTRHKWSNRKDEDEYIGCDADSFMFWKDCHEPAYDHYHKKNVKRRKYIKKQEDKAIYTNIVCNNNFKFTHAINHCLSLKPDAYLKKKVIITYWNQRFLQFEGQITCISHLGFIRLQDVEYMGDINAGFTQFGVPQNIQNAYWFHYKCIESIIMYNHNTAAYDLNITAIIMDLLKLKVFSWLNTATKLAKRDILNVKHLHVNGEHMDSICQTFWDEQDKINPFVLYLNKYRSLQKTKLKFTKEDLTHIIHEYHMKASKDNHTSKAIHKNTAKMDYLIWDSTELERSTTRRCVRTV